MPSGKKPLPEPTLNHIYIVIWHHYAIRSSLINTVCLTAVLYKGIKLINLVCIQHAVPWQLVNIICTLEKARIASMGNGSTRGYLEMSSWSVISIPFKYMKFHFTFQFFSCLRDGEWLLPLKTAIQWIFRFFGIRLDIHPYRKSDQQRFLFRCDLHKNVCLPPLSIKPENKTMW